MSSLKGTTCSCLILREKDKVTHMCHGTVANLTAKQQEIKAKLRQFVMKTRELKKKKKKRKKMPLWKKDVLWFVWVKNSR